MNCVCVCGFKCCTRMEICLLSIISLYFNTLSMQPTKKIDFRHFAKKRTLNQNFSTCILLYIIFFLNLPNWQILVQYFIYQYILCVPIDQFIISFDINLQSKLCGPKLPEITDI